MRILYYNIRMKRKSLTMGESNSAVLSAFFGSVVGSLIYMLIPLLFRIFGLGMDQGVADALALIIPQLFMLGGAAFYLLVIRKVNIFRVFDFGVKKADFKRLALTIPITIGAILCFAPFADLFSYILTKLGYTSVSGLLENSESSLIGLISSMAALVLVAPFVEEILFRGVLLNGAKRKRGPFFGIVYTATVFMLFHGNPDQTVHQFLLGLVIGYLAVISGNILYGLAVHVLNNIAALFLSFVYIDASHIDMSETWLLVTVYAGCVVIGAVTLYFAIKAFKSLNDRSFGLSKAESLFKRLRGKQSVKTAIQAFNDRYDPLNKFGGEIPEDAIFAISSGEDKKFPASSILIFVVFILIWLFMLAAGFLGGLLEAFT